VIARRTLDAALAIIFALPLVSLWTEPAAVLTVQLLAAAVLLLTAVRPALGLCLLAALLPVSPALHATMPVVAVTREAQALVLAFLAAGFARLAFATPGPASRLAIPAGLLGLVIAARAATFTAADLADLSLPGALAAVSTHLTREYFAPHETLVDLHRAMSWIVALALAVLVERYLRKHREMTEPVLRLAIVGAAAGALFTVFRAGQMVAASGEGIAGIGRMIREYRFNPFYADVNATGSLLLLYLIPAAWIAVTRREAWAWASAVLLASGLWFSGSRAAVLAAFGGAAVAWMMARRAPRRWWVAAVVMLAGVAALSIWSTRPRRATLEEALTIRWNMTVASVNAAASDPLLGIGVDRLKNASAPFITPEFARLWPPAAAGENAHNNFVQVLAESGVLGVMAFVWMLAAAIGASSRWRTDATADAVRPGVAAGVAAFVLTCLAGHPLLIEPVRLCFFLWLGCLAAGTSVAASPTSGRWRSIALAASSALVVILVLPRIASARRDGNAVGHTTGAGAPAGKVDGVPYRPAGRHSAWMIAPDTTELVWLLRADFGSPAPCTVEVHVDRQLGAVVALGSVKWEPVRLTLAPPARSRPSRRLDVRIKTEGCALLAGPMTLR
jgi:hypothetical protein